MPSLNEAFASSKSRKRTGFFEIINIEFMIFSLNDFFIFPLLNLARSKPSSVFWGNYLSRLNLAN